MGGRDTRTILLHFGIVLSATAFAMWPSLQNGFVNWDDPGYVTSNLLIRDLSFQGIGEIFRTPSVVGLYHPLTLISLAIDYAISGLDPTQYHRVNFLLHLINSCLVYIFCRRIGLQSMGCLLIAILFGVHPMHVESVAWVSGRKDLLYTMFLLSGLIAWRRYSVSAALRSKYTWYLVTLVFMLLSVLSKVSAVVFPFLILAMDYLSKRKLNMHVYVEKVPFLIVSIAFGILAIHAQDISGALDVAPESTAINRILVAGHSLLTYVIRAVVPYQLSPFHPYTHSMLGALPWYIYASWIPLFIAVYYLLRSSNRTVHFSGIFFLLAIVAGLQVYSVGMAVVADRYSYLSYIGLFIVFVSLIPVHYTKVRIAATVLGCIAVVCYATISFRYARVWENGGTLWSRVVAVYPEDFYGYYNRGDYYLSTDNFELAESDFKQAVKLNSQFADSYHRLGVLYEDNR